MKSEGKQLSMNKMMTHNWHEYRKTINLDGRHWVNGQRVDSVDGDTINKDITIDGKYLVTFSRGKKTDIDMAVDVAYIIRQPVGVVGAIVPWNYLLINKLPVVQFLISHKRSPNE